jgi:hypothetical protein
MCRKNRRYGQLAGKLRRFWFHDRFVDAAEGDDA